jgi:hypothetical protein
MRIEIDVNTGEQIELPDAPITNIGNKLVTITPPTKEELMAQLLAIQLQIQTL